MNRKFVSLPAGKKTVVVELQAAADKSKVVRGIMAVFGSQPDVALSWHGTPRLDETSFQKADEPDRKNARTDPGYPGMFFWLL